MQQINKAVDPQKSKARLIIKKDGIEELLVK